MRKLLLLALCAVLLPTPRAAAQAEAAGPPHAVAPGARVRAVLEGPARPLVGRLVHVHGDTAWIVEERSQTEYAVALGPRAALEVSLGADPDRAAGRGGLYGAALGAAVGAILMGSLDPSGPGYDYFPGSRRNAILIGIVGFGMPGAVVGAISGLASGGERWEPARPAAPEISPPPAPR